MGIGTFIVHKKLRGSFADYRKPSTGVCSLNGGNVDAGGIINDLDSVTLNFYKGERKTMLAAQKIDMKAARETIEKFASKLGVTAKKGQAIFEAVAQGKIPKIR